MPVHPAAGLLSTSKSKGFGVHVWRLLRTAAAGVGRPGSPGEAPGFPPPEVIVEVKALACESPSTRGVPLSRGSRAELAHHVEDSGLVGTISGSTIWRWLSKDAIRPWQYRSWVFPRDPEFSQKAAPVLRLVSAHLGGAAAGPCRRPSVPAVQHHWEAARPRRRARRPHLRVPAVPQRAGARRVHLRECGELRAHRGRHNRRTARKRTAGGGLRHVVRDTHSLGLRRRAHAETFLYPRRARAARAGPPPANARPTETLRAAPDRHLPRRSRRSSGRRNARGAHLLESRAAESS